MEEIQLDVKIGAQEVAPKAATLREKLTIAASVALLDIDENEKQALEKIKQEAGEKRGKIKKQLKEMLDSSDMRIVRKFWHSKTDDLFLHFIGDRTKVGNIGSVE